MRNTKTRRPSPARAAMKLLCTVLGLILVLMIAVTVSIHSLMDRLHYVGPSLGTLISQHALSGLSSDKSQEIDSGSTDIFAGEDSDVLNILLIGQDRREGEDRARSDAMILCSFNKTRKTLVLTSILRDLYVQIPGYQDNRINAAYASGGMELLNETLEQNLGIRVDGNVEVDFDRFSRIINLLGGVTLDLRQDEAELINQEVGGTLTEGSCHLNGIQALTYARIRKLDADGDFSRTSRQQKLLQALLASYKHTGFTSLLGIVDELLPMLTTDIPGPRLAAYALELFPMLSQMEVMTHRIPADGTYTAQTIRGMSVLTADLEKNQEALRDAVIGKTG